MKVSRSTAGRSPAGVRLGRRRRRELFSAGSSPGRALAAVPVAETVSRVAAVPFRGGGGSSSGRRGGGGAAPLICGGAQAEDLSPYRRRGQRAGLSL